MVKEVISLLFNQKKESWIIYLFQLVLNTSLILLSLILSFLLLRELYIISVEVFIGGDNNVHEVLQKVLDFFLYFVFVSLIVKYFKENYHFPLRYFIYLGITGTLRFIIVSHENPIANFVFSLVILVLMISYIMLTLERS